MNKAHTAKEKSQVKKIKNQGREIKESIVLQTCSIF
jgi:hypothetical protein